jgi:DNA-binding CsgD family transcriptional regulator
MARSARLRGQDLRAIYTLLGECRELGDDPIVWRRHFLAGLVRALGAGVGTEVEGNTDTVRPPDGTADWGWHGAFDRRVWAGLIDEYTRHGFEFNPAFTAYHTARDAGRGPCFTRSDLLTDADWYKSRYFQQYHRPAGGDYFLGCHIPLGGGRERMLILVRAPDEPDFPQRAKVYLREAVVATQGLIGGPLAGYVEPAPSALPPRTREVLRCLLEGDSDKQIAARLDMARLTVNQHTKRIYRHFVVNSRAELLARWIRRGWGVGGWAPPDRRRS